MWRPVRLSVVLALACGGETDSASEPPFECPCGSALAANELAESFDDKLAEYTASACDIAGVAFRAECSDGKSLLFIDGGYGHTALYYLQQQLVGSSQSSDVYLAGCPSNFYGGALEDVTCERVSTEPLCPSRELPSVTIPFADGQLTPWCEPRD